MAVASNRYSGLDGLGVSEFVFYFEGFDENTELVRIDKDGKVLAPSDKDWEKAKDSDEALQAYNIARYGRTTGQTSIDVADDDILNARYLVAFGNESNVETGPRLTGTSDRNFYNGGPQAFRPPSEVTLVYQTPASEALAYPFNIDLGQDHLQINKFEYTRDAATGGANLSKPGDRISRNENYKGTVILPMPKVSDSNGAEWGESDLNVFGVGAVETLSQFGRLSDKLVGAGFNLEEIKKSITSFAQGVPLPTAGDLRGSAGVGGALGGSALLKTAGITVEPDALLARATGKIINPNAELLFQGPVLRDFGFQYLMVARSKEEGDQIRRIIRFFKEGAAPKYRNQALLATPDIFSLEYQTPGNPGILNRFHDMALRTITVDYAPDGFWSAYEDSQPVAVRMSLQFTELKPVYDSDYQIGPVANADEYAGSLKSANGVGY